MKAKRGKKIIWPNWIPLSLWISQEKQDRKLNFYRFRFFFLLIFNKKYNKNEDEKRGTRCREKKNAEARRELLLRSMNFCGDTVASMTRVSNFDSWYTSSEMTNSLRKFVLWVLTTYRNDRETKIFLLLCLFFFSFFRWDLKFEFHFFYSSFRFSSCDKCKFKEIFAKSF